MAAYLSLSGLTIVGFERLSHWKLGLNQLLIIISSFRETINPLRAGPFIAPYLCGGRPSSAAASATLAAARWLLLLEETKTGPRPFEKTLKKVMNNNVLFVIFKCTFGLFANVSGVHSTHHGCQVTSVQVAAGMRRRESLREATCFQESSWRGGCGNTTLFPWHHSQCEDDIISSVHSLHFTPLHCTPAIAQHNKTTCSQPAS